MIDEETLSEFREADTAGKKEIARRVGRSVGRLYNACRERGKPIREGRNRNRGKRKAADKVLTAVASIKFAGAADRSKKTADSVIPTDVAIEIAERSGLIKPGAVKPSAVNRWLAERGLDAKGRWEPSPAKALRSKGPNHVHQVDATVFTQYYLKRDDTALGRAYVGLDSGYKNKKKKGKKVWLYMLVDHATGAFFARYYIAKRESSELLAMFLHEAWSRKNDQTKNPFCGMPQVLFSDSGTGLKEKRWRNVLDSLGVVPLTHMPGNPRAKGSVERHIRLVQQRFESRTTVRPAETVEELNSWLDDWSAEFQAKRAIRRADTPRMVLWRENVSEGSLRLPPPYENFVQGLSAAEPRVLRGGYLSYNGRKFFCPVRELAEKYDKKTITILPSPFADETLAMIFENGRDERVVLRDIAPVATDRYGQAESAALIGDGFKGAREPERVKLLKKLDRADLSEIDPYKADTDDIDYEELKIPISVAETPAAFVDRHRLFRKLFAELERGLTELEKEYIARLPEMVDEREIYRIARLFARGEEAVLQDIADRDVAAG